MSKMANKFLITWGDYIGWYNVSAHNQGVMGYRTPKVDRVTMSTDWHGQQSCPAGRAAFLEGASDGSVPKKIAA